MTLIVCGLIGCEIIYLRDDSKTSQSSYIGKLIREARKQKGYSQEGFAAEAGLGRTYLGRVERGEQNI